MPGIYQIVNIINNKKYIGSSVDIEKRWLWHKSRLNNNRHYNNYLQKAWNKYGENCFQLSLIEETERNVLLEKEQDYLDTLKPEYNISEKASGGDLGLLIREKLRITSKGNKSNLGKKFSEEHKTKIGEANKGKRKGMKASIETRLKMSLARSGKNHPMYGKHHNDETKRKISNTLKSNTKEII